MRALKIIMVIFGSILAIEGILDIAMPAQRAEAMGLGPCATRAEVPMAILGATWIIVGSWIIAAARDPLRYLRWVSFSLAFSLALVVALLVSVARGVVPFEQVAGDVVVAALFFVLFVIFYPRGTGADTTRRTHEHAEAFRSTIRDPDLAER